MSLVTSDIDLEALGRVDEVHSLIKRLVENPKENDLLDKEVDNYLSNSKNKTAGFSKTVINTSQNSGSTKDGFLKELEKDAHDRAARKAQSKATADLIKKKANDYFNANDFEKAIGYYSQAIRECIDYDILYTNRAQAYLKIERPLDALADCDMALRISPGNHKAFLHRGRSLVRLSRFDEALESYNKVLEIAPQLQKYVEEFIGESRALKATFEVGKRAQDTFSGGDGDGGQDSGSELLATVVAKLASAREQPLEFFVGGLHTVLRMCDEGPLGTVERLRADLKTGHGVFAAACQLRAQIGASLATTGTPSETETALLAGWLELLARTADGDDAAITALFAPADGPPPICACLEHCCRVAAAAAAANHESASPLLLLRAAVTLLLRLSASEVGLQQIFERVATGDVLAVTMRAVRCDKRPQLVTRAMALFENLARSHRFKVALGRTELLVQPLIECVHATLVASVARLDASTHLDSVISIVELLADNSAIRARLMRHDNFLDDCVKAIEARLPVYDDDKHGSTLLQLFSMVHNLLARARLVAPVPDRIRGHCGRVVTASSLLVSQPHGARMRAVLIQVLAQLLPLLTEDQLARWCSSSSSSSSLCGASGARPVSVPSAAPSAVSGSPSGTDEAAAVSMCRSLSRQSSLTDLGYLDKVCKPLRLCVTVLDATVTHHPLLPDAIKILALTARVSQPVRFLCCDVRDRVVRLQSLLSDSAPIHTHTNTSSKLDESVCGNICLLFMHCVAETPLAEHLADTGIIKSLLRICADANKPDCRRNAAIFAGKLAQSNHVHRAELSRLNGFSIVSRFNDWR